MRFNQTRMRKYLLLSLLILETICCEYNPSNDDTKCISREFQKGQTISLKKWGNKLDLSLIRGPIFADSFPLLLGIKEMTLRSSNISDIESGFFHQFPNLESLTIKINHGFPNITTRIFKGCCPKLTSFKVLDNNLRYFDNQVFKTMPKLEFLWIEKQNLGPLEANYFSGLSSLKKLRLQYCEIKRIEQNAFDDLTNLVKLELPTNQVEKIQPGTFKNLKKLEELHLSGNSIRNFTGGEFNGLDNLKRLELIGNKINSLNVEKILENLPKLERIGIKLTLFECDRAKSLVERIKENNIEIKNVDEVLKDSCSKDSKEQD
ncbi:leucine-rich repeat-containing protein 4B-like [Tribolium madens]|uniref:leucine-rich repeat-containing protein 4B-like n=1 Tax=Tribolium madens TaxID=41895 RepID=UPI001CF738F7|nr:leucine-rich repeat-containing protein 4B-like [Tribolium madens]